MPHDDPSQIGTESLIAANAAFYETFEALDMDGMAGLWEESDRIFCVHPGWQALRGRQSILESWEVILANTTRIKFTLTGVEARVEGELGIVTVHENIISEVGKERHSAAAVSKRSRLVRSVDRSLEMRSWPIARSWAARSSRI